MEKAISVSSDDKEGECEGKVFDIACFAYQLTGCYRNFLENEREIFFAEYTHYINTYLLASFAAAAF